MNNNKIDNKIDNKITQKMNKYLDCIDIIYWINLDRSIKRRESMENILKDVTIKQKRINATDGKAFTTNEMYSKFINNGSFNRTIIEYAVLHSHLKTIDEFANSGYEIALIFEDDLSCEYVPLWDQKVSDIVKNAPPDWDILMLSYLFLYQLNSNYTKNTNGLISCCLAYVINKKGAKKLMERLKRKDKYILLQGHHHTSDNYIFGLLNTYAYKYPYFTYPSSNDSTIHPESLLLHFYSKKIAEKSWKEKYNTSELKDIVYCDFTTIHSIVFISCAIIFIMVLFLIYKKHNCNKHDCNKIKYNKSYKSYKLYK